VLRELYWWSSSRVYLRGAKAVQVLACAAASCAEAPTGCQAVQLDVGVLSCLHLFDLAWLLQQSALCARQQAALQHKCKF
jgi:hypothetical protein